jgi:flavin reductase (DIM6/NTAB) family NADH-FMN oxidoreductase RutF
MKRDVIAAEHFVTHTHARWGKEWMLLTAGDFRRGHFNAMTVGWGSFGTMWTIPFAQVVVRPTRYTYEFMEQYPTFTLCGFSASYRNALQLLGSKSGRDGDKITESSLTPIESTQVAAPGFAEADLIVECRKMYWDDLNPEHFLDAGIETHYSLKDYHRIYFGEIVTILGTNTYTTPKMS